MPTSIRRVKRHLGRAGRLVLLGSLVVTAALSAQSAAPPLASSAAPLVIQGVTVIDVQTGQHIPNQTVVIAERRIQTITLGTTQLPSGAQVVDGRGKYLIPGLWDMHTHISRAPWAFGALIASGTTGIRDVGPLDSNLEQLLRWRREITDGTLVGPRMVVTGIMIDVADVAGWARGVTTPEDARHVVDSLKAAGADFIKIHSSGLSREVYFAVAAESRRLGIPFVGHLPIAVTAAEASDSGQRSIEHGNEFRGPCSGLVSGSTGRPYTKENETGCAAQAAQFIKNGTWFTPSIKVLFVYAPLLGDKAGDEAKRLVHESYRFGVPMLAGTDLTAPPALTDELKLMVEAGMTPLDALRAATLNPAKFFGATDTLGTVSPGKVADLVLLDADPLQDIGNTTAIRAVIANGRYYDRVALDELAQQAAAMRPDTAKASP